MSHTPHPAGPPEPIVFTDLDGTLLDHSTYSFAPAAGALAELRRRHTPVVLATSKTRAEVRTLMKVLALESPAIVENGGALLLPRGHLRTPAGARRIRGFDVLPLGAERPALVRALREIASETGARLRGFADMTSSEVRERTGLRGEAVRHACEREFDEPFVLETPALAAAVAQAARRRGLRVARGGRFFHLTGDTDKGRAVGRLLALYAAEGRHFFSVGLGDAANDVDMLRAVDRPILVPRPDGSFDPDLERALPHAERAPAPGAEGWSAAVGRYMRGEVAAPPREVVPS